MPPADGPDDGPDDGRTPARARRPGLLVAVLGVLAPAAAWLVHGGVTGAGPARADGDVLATAGSLRSPALNGLAVAVTTVGSTVAMAVLALLVGGVLWWRGRRFDAAWLVAVTATTSLLFTLVKLLVDRSRPPEVARVVDVANSSMPSGHAVMSVAVLGALVALAWPDLTRAGRAGLVAGAVGWVLAVGATRVYLGVHWVTDVVAGWLLAAGWLAVAVRARPWLAARTDRWWAGTGAP